MRFSRHAKNEMRLYSVGVGEAEAVVRDPASTAFDRDGNMLAKGPADPAGAITVVIAHDDPSFVITVFRTR